MIHLCYSADIHLQIARIHTFEATLNMSFLQSSSQVIVKKCINSLLFTKGGMSIDKMVGVSHE